MHDLNSPIIKKPNHPKQNIDRLHNLALWKSTRELRKVDRNSTHYSPEKEEIELKQRQYKIKTGDNKKKQKSNKQKLEKEREEEAKFEPTPF